MPFVPGEQAVGEAVVAPAGELADARQSHQPAEPTPARRHRPDRDCDVGADQQAALLVNHVQAVADLIDAFVDLDGRFRRRGDVAPGDGVAALRQQAVHPGALLLDPGAADRAGGVVVELGLWRQTYSLRRACSSFHSRLPRPLASWVTVSPLSIRLIVPQADLDKVTPCSRCSTKASAVSGTQRFSKSIITSA